MANNTSGSISKRMQKRAEQRRKKRQVQLIVGIVAIIVLALAGWALVGNFSGPEAVTTTGLPAEVNIEEAYGLVQSGAFLLDVREQHEWDSFHATDATLIPLGELASRIDEVPPDQEIVVICNSGNRSRTGRDILFEAGFSSVTSAAGGSQAWRSAGYPIE
jgi:rhodanese-related sulfurtransferase